MTKEAANTHQVGGDHYAAGIQHWDFVAANHLNYFEGQITKYVSRCRKKNGIQDLEKARHFLDKYMELYASITAHDPAPANSIPYEEEVERRKAFTVEGYRTDGTALFQCVHCKKEAWACAAPHGPAAHHSTCPHTGAFTGAPAGP